MTDAVVAAAQLGPSGPDRSETVARIVTLITAAARSGVELLVFPELALTPYFASKIHDDVTTFAEVDFPTERTAPIVQAVRETGIVTVLPLAELAGGVLFNSSVVLGSDGDIIGRYRKSHIPGQVEPDAEADFSILEKRYFAPGDLGFVLHPTPVGPLGIGICYDRRFPELYRCYALLGAGVIACCFNTPLAAGRGETLESTQEAQELAVRGGAIANAVPVIAAGKAGVEGGLRYSGGSCVIDHRGRFVAKAETDGDELVIANLDLAAAAEARTRMDLEGNRRPALYEILTRAQAVPTPVIAPELQFVTERSS
jgi:predicted amidohydrolase